MPEVEVAEPILVEVGFLHALSSKYPKEAINVAADDFDTVAAADLLTMIVDVGVAMNLGDTIGCSACGTDLSGD